MASIVEEKQARVLKIVKNAVGTNGDNQKMQVLLIQDLLNRNLHLLPETYPLVEDGQDKRTNVQAILAFQSIVKKTGVLMVGLI